MADLLSIISPVKNAAPFLEDCIQSVLKQSFNRWEWILVDDHSTDNSFEILQAAALADSRIRVFENQGQGIISALQQAFENSEGQWISRMDADDLMPDNRLQKMISTLKLSPPKTVVTGKVQYFSKLKVSAGYLNYETWLNGLVDSNLYFENIYRECVVASPNWLMRSSELEAIGGFKNLEYPEDYDLVFKWFQHGYSLTGIPETTLHWREHPLRTSRHSTHYQQEAFFKLKIKRFVELSYHQKDLLLWGAGSKGRLTASILQGLNIPFTWMDWQYEKYTKGVFGQKIKPFTDTTLFGQPQILLAIHPPKAEKEKIESYLVQQKLLAGVNYWYL